MAGNKKVLYCDHIVIGGCVVGCCITYFLSSQKKEVICIDSGEFSGSYSNAGSIHVQMQSRNFRLNPHLIVSLVENIPFYKEAVTAWQKLSSELNVDFDLKINGGLMVAENSQQLEFLTRKCKEEKNAGLEVEILGTSKIRKEFPFLSHKVVGAEFCAHEGKLNPLIANKSLQDKCLLNGATIMKSEIVNNIEFKNNEYLIKTNKKEYCCEKLVIAAGSGSGKLVKGLNITIPTTIAVLIIKLFLSSIAALISFAFSVIAK